MKRRISVAIALAFAWGAGVAALPAETASGRSSSIPPGVKRLEAAGLHNLFAVGDRFYSGSTPEGEEGFAALARLGVKTIISVDGAKPDVETARAHGMRYVHLPHGYDGISPALQLQLTKAGQTLAGPIYVHCHHGKHRGPTAAAILCMGNDQWTPDQAEAWLIMAGTATNYSGLYEVVQGFHMPTKEQLRGVSADFPETTQVAGLIETMVDVDEHWEHLKEVRAAAYRTPARHPDLKPPNEAVILWEHYREAQRLSDSIRRGSDFVDRLGAAELEAKEAERLLRQFVTEPKPEVRMQLDRIFDAMGKTCASCHKAHRDPAGIKSRP